MDERLSITTRSNPLNHFSEWYEIVKKSDPQPDAVALGTASIDGIPSLRMVLVKSWSETGFEFFTNRKSRKGQELLANKNAALTWHWKGFGAQVRIKGEVSVIEESTVMAYWRSRSYGSKISALASSQSSAIIDRDVLVEKVERLRLIYDKDSDVPLPKEWGGFRVHPSMYEFWLHDLDRLHYRIEYVNVDDKWVSTILQP